MKVALVCIVAGVALFAAAAIFLTGTEPPKPPACATAKQWPPPVRRAIESGSYSAINPGDPARPDLSPCPTGARR